MRLERRAGQVILSIHDNGRGIIPPPPGNGHSGMGMIGMRARARSLGGDLGVNSRPGGGVEIRVSIPVEHEAHTHTAG
jgi:signal transduction histidine kinase